MDNDRYEQFEKKLEAIEKRRLKEGYYDKNYASAEAEMMKDFLNERRAISYRETIDLGFPYWEYARLQDRNYHIGRLMFKEWGQKMSLQAFFELGVDVLTQAKFTTFRNREGKYQPAKGHVDLSDAMIGNQFILKLNFKDKGNSFIEEIWSVDSEEEAEKMLLQYFRKNLQ